MTEHRDAASSEPDDGDGQEQGQNDDEKFIPSADPKPTSGEKWSRDEGDSVEHAHGT
jgi:hypothetical protein